MSLDPIGWVRSSRTTPADRGHGWDRETASIELDADRFDSAALAGIDTFSHVEVVFVFDRVDEDDVLLSRRPAGVEAWPEVGIFAQRFSRRPNRIGVTRCAVLGTSGISLSVGGLDAIDGTPVLDIKPWFIEYGPRGSVIQPEWVSELMEDYW